MTAASEPASRRADPADIPASERVDVNFDGRVLAGRRGETVAATLAAHGVSVFRRTGSGSPRGLFCGMGVCHDCLVEVDGRANQRACMTTIETPLTIRSGQGDRIHAEPGARAPVARDVEADIAVAGGGAAGLTAACVAAEAGARVVVIDDLPVAGGQYFRQPARTLDPPPRGRDDRQFAGGRALLKRARTAGVEILSGTLWAAEDAGHLRIRTEQGEGTVRARRLVVATGACERGYPVPGWTLPGVMTTGAAQTLLRSYRVLAGRRILVAGNGPLNLQVALELAHAGATVVAVVEAARRPGAWALAPLSTMAAASPDLALQGARHVRHLRRLGIPLIHGHIVDRIDGGAGDLAVSLRETGGAGIRSVHKADTVTLGYGFQPANDLLRRLGCRHEVDAVRGNMATVRDGDCRTSVETVFAAGDCAGLGGAFAAVADGVIAGAAAARDLGFALSEAAVRGEHRARTDRVRHRRFQAALWSIYAADLPSVPGRPETVVCRCEEVTLGQVEAALEGGDGGIGSLKEATRLGRGRCKGRYCAPVAAALLAERTGQPEDPVTVLASRLSDDAT